MVKNNILEEISNINLTELENKVKLSTKLPKRISEPTLPNKLESRLYSKAVALSRTKLEKRFVSTARQLRLGIGNLSDIIVDIGCGQGISTYGLSQAFRKSLAVGMDVDHKEINHAIAQYGQINNIYFELAGAEDISSCVEKPNLITSFNTIHHFEYPLDAFRAIYNALKPGGIFYFEDFDRSVLKLDQAERLRRYHNLRTHFGDKRSMESYAQTKPIGLKDIQFLSVSAAYTPEELKEMGRIIGFKSRILKVENLFLRGLFKKSN